MSFEDRLTTASGCPEAIELGEEADARIAELEAQIETTTNTAISVLREGLCETHSAHVGKISFREFVEWDKAQGCKACSKQRIAELEAENAKLWGSIAYYESLLAGER